MCGRAEDYDCISVCPIPETDAAGNSQTREARRSENLLKEKMLRERILKMRNSSEDDALAGNRS